jgi:hypothetical protein
VRRLECLDYFNGLCVFPLLQTVSAEHPDGIGKHVKELKGMTVLQRVSDIRSLEISEIRILYLSHLSLHLMTY